MHLSCRDSGLRAAGGCARGTVPADATDGRAKLPPAEPAQIEIRGDPRSSGLPAVTRPIAVQFEIQTFRVYSTVRLRLRRRFRYDLRCCLPYACEHVGANNKSAARNLHKADAVLEYDCREDARKERLHGVRKGGRRCANATLRV